uniref:Uncharacterized protein n=1 Tax=Bartonella rochalimae ATCC BAA-1498 TaxID=685782 RepID=E6YLJ9_9HYPH|nr:hypothetical protein BARRO_50100 [Bartonella rochalimae ATCC BAA-1498]
MTNSLHINYMNILKTIESTLIYKLSEKASCIIVYRITN